MHLNILINLQSITDSPKDVQIPLQQHISADIVHQSSYLQLLQQREEEHRQEVAKLTSEIKSLKVQLMQIRSKY